MFRKLTYMKPRKPPSEFAVRRGRLIQRARLAAGWSQARLAKEIGVKSREVVSQYESGSIEQIGVLTCRALVVKLGMLPSDLAEDPSVFQFDDELPTMSTEARRLARRFDSIPEAWQKWITDTIDKLESMPSPPADEAPPAARKRRR